MIQMQNITEGGLWRNVGNHVRIPSGGDFFYGSLLFEARNGNSCRFFALRVKDGRQKRYIDGGDTIELENTSGAWRQYRVSL